MKITYPVKKSDYEKHGRKLYAMPKEHETIQFKYEISEKDMKKIKLGLHWEEFEDKWIVYCENNKVYCHRSWTRYCIYIFEFLPNSIISLTKNQNPKQIRFPEININDAIYMLEMIIRKHKDSDLKNIINKIKNQFYLFF